MRKLAEVRNAFAHDVEHASTNLLPYISSLERSRQNDMIRVFASALKEKMPLRDQLVARNMFTRENPRIAIWISAVDLLAHIQLASEDIAVRKADQRAEAAAGLLRKLANRGLLKRMSLPLLPLQKDTA